MENGENTKADSQLTPIVIPFSLQSLLLCNTHYSANPTTTPLRSPPPVGTPNTYGST